MSDSDTAYLEIVELPDGGIALRPAGSEEGEPWVRIQFSSEAKAFLRYSHWEVAQEMISAGMEKVEALSQEEQQCDDKEPTLH